MKISWDVINYYRSQTYRTSEQSRLCSAEEAIQFVNERGFTFFWPAKDVPLPSLWNATAGIRPVPSEHDDPGNITWDWKDSLLDKKVWYYARILDNRNAMISIEMMPFFYALSPNYGDYEFDYLESYHMGYMTNAAKTIYETLISTGPMDTISLRKVSHLTGEKQKSAFLKYINDLQKIMYILPIGISRSGGWRYSFIYDIPARYFTDLQEKSKMISEDEARKMIAWKYLQSIGAAQVRFFMRLFHWSEPIIRKTVAELIKENICCDNVEFDQFPGKWIVLKTLI